VPTQDEFLECGANQRCRQHDLENAKKGGFAPEKKGRAGVRQGQAE